VLTAGGSIARMEPTGRRESAARWRNPGKRARSARISHVLHPGYGTQIQFSNSACLQTRLRDLAAPFARGLLSISLTLRSEGTGKTGCALHPRSRVQDRAFKNAHEHTGSAETLRPSLRSGFTAYTCSPRRSGFACHRRPRSLSCELDANPEAVRTTRLRRTLRPRSSRAPSRPPQPIPTFVTLRNAPPSGTGSDGYRLICNF